MLILTFLFLVYCLSEARITHTHRHTDSSLLSAPGPSLSLPQLIEIVGRINVTSSTCVHEFSRFFWRLCRTFGKIFTNTKVRP